jgi:hypothetical protein
MKCSLPWLVQLNSIVDGAVQVFELMAAQDAMQAVAAAVLRMPVERLLQLGSQNFLAGVGEEQRSGPMRWRLRPTEACSPQISFAT